MNFRTVCCAGFLFVAVCCSANAEEPVVDWPQFLGPERNGVSTDPTKLVEKFPDNGPTVLWKTDLGKGFAGPLVVGQSVYIFHRVGGQAHLMALSAATGKQEWDFAYATNYKDSFGFDNGPRACPTVSGNSIFTYGAEGQVHAVARDSGKLLWERDLVEDFGSEQGFFGRAGAPLVVEDKVIVHPGGPDASVIALDKDTGKTLWKAGKQAAGYASPMLWESQGGPCIVCLLREGLMGLDPKDGKVLFETHYRSTMEASVNAATPVAINKEEFFTSSSYGVGAALWKQSAKGLEPVWKEVGKLDAQYATPIYAQGHLFGMHGRVDTGSGQELRCLEAATGKQKWSSGRLAPGELISADGKLIVLTEDGELILAARSTDAWKLLDRGQILSAGHRSPPALSQGVLYARDKQKLVAVKLTP